jgi:hypothetical protein
MKLYITSLALIGILISCDSSSKNKTDTQDNAASEAVVDNASVDVNKQLVAIDTDEGLIATALMAAPKASRSGCKVIGYNMAGEFVTLREGDNEFIVLVDDPKQDGFNAACYHKDLEPFMARGRVLKAEGKTREEIFDIREEEMKSGKIKIPTGATLHIYFGTNSMYDPATSKVEGAKLRYVVYMPWATSKTTGLPESPMAPNHPWLMEPGTHRAHIMISPLQDEGA